MSKSHFQDAKKLTLAISGRGTWNVRKQTKIEWGGIEGPVPAAHVTDLDSIPFSLGNCSLIDYSDLNKPRTQPKNK